MPIPTYTKIATKTLTNAQTTLVFSSIPENYRDLVLVMSAQSSSSTIYNVDIRFNGDAGANYSNVQIIGNGTAAQSTSGTGSTGVSAIIHASTHPSGNVIINIFDYWQINKHKNVLVRDTTPSESARLRSGVWASTAAIRSISIIPNTTFPFNLQVGSTFSLYGII